MNTPQAAGSEPAAASSQAADREALARKLSEVPISPGVYLFRDASLHVLYVGKAKQLRSRLKSYFQPSAALDRRKTEMVRNVRDFEYLVTANELEAFVLEANLIKQHRPRYNVLLRDDKSYPYLRLTVQEEWPRLEVVRRIRKDGARYYGPYVPAGPMWSMLSFLRNAFKLPNCRHAFAKRLRPCIQHQMGRCVAPCAGLADRRKYLRSINNVRMILEGRNAQLAKELEKKMQRLSDGLKYEEAAAVRDLLVAVRQMSEQQNVVSPKLGDIDVFGLSRGTGSAVCKVLFVRNGVMIGSRDLRVRDGAAESNGEFMGHILGQFYARDLLPPAEVLCSFPPSDSDLLGARLAKQRGAAVKITAPRRGLKRKLLQMAEENAQILAKTAPAGDDAAVKEIVSRLGLASLPASIGAFDISNLSGKASVGAFVWWEHGSFRKDRYRQVLLDGVAGPDDYAMMREAVARIAANLLKQKQEAAAPGLPDLLIIDGGKAHLDTAVRALKETGVSVETVAIAKDPDRLFTPRRKTPLDLADMSASSLLLRAIRDEVHRFVVSLHRKRRGRSLRESSLDKIYGIGRKRRVSLLDRFGSIEAVSRATEEEIAKVEGFNRKIARDVLEALKSKADQGGV